EALRNAMENIQNMQAQKMREQDRELESLMERPEELYVEPKAQEEVLSEEDFAVEEESPDMDALLADDTEETVVQEEEIPAEEEIEAEEEEIPAEEETVAEEEEIPAEEETETEEEEIPAEEEIEVEEEEFPAEEEIEAEEEEFPLVDEILGDEEIPAEEETVAQEEEIPVQEEIEVEEEEFPLVDEILGDEEIPAEEETVAQEEEIPVQEEIEADKENILEDFPFPTVEEILQDIEEVTEDNPQEEEIEAQEEETPAEEEIEAQKEEIPAEENLAQKVTALTTQDMLEKIERILSDDDAASTNADKIEMFKKLRLLCDFLPESEKDTFQSCRNRMVIDYIISKLSGKPGLLITAQSLIKSGILGEAYDSQLMKKSEDELNNELVRKVIKIMKSMSGELEDKALSEAMKASADNILERIELVDQKSQIFS
ncbi:MAG: hypothetical protein K5866_06030, partial [Treponema sp.]|nr:hypothetical protein [Treponema sp.]